MSEPILLCEDRDGIRTLTLNNPAARNALSGTMMALLHEAFVAAAAEPAVRVVILAANGPAFCAGHDLKEMRGNSDPVFHARLMDQCVALMLAIVRCPKPVIARVHAIATAAGCQLVASCDLAVAADSAHFATPGVNIGLFCSTPMVALSRNLGPKHAMEMLLIGDLVNAHDAWRMGLLNRVVEAGQLDASVAEFAQRIASKSSHTLAVGKEAFYAQAEMSLEEAYRHCAAVMVRNMQSNDAREGIDAFFHKRPACWQDS
ncbi:MAG: enoyl-CoA hydratase [Gammaproteobacteria bacterium]|jgi:enoyl-CoA hydratase/carnithine racemase|nr:enoyl-CoA hydratase [Gammaproteobacteria bacterium]MBP6050927.1 enoyl-CoA hydratase [Pseudomonadales bacterium]MBK6582434.1 enoyl-CoA hydratase [Gammaproteobacteria bacterium]MBK7169581.1 enoyl-CoA hydratase [Gammaproteobacteria bacterium]MBK7729071.1 enoyl-CoA hydratase [Gammaproteobacteria bacterium]